MMSGNLAMTPNLKSSDTTKPTKIACPKCDASIRFFRNDTPHIDDGGFETYNFKCKACGSMLAGIIDPMDDALLLTISPQTTRR